MTDDDKALVEELEEWEWTLRAAYKSGDLGTDEPAIVMGKASSRIEQLGREKDVVSDLWEQQKEIALGYLADCNALSAENERLTQRYNELGNAAMKQVAELGAKVGRLEVENERLHEALREVFEQWAGSEGFIPETAPEGYLLQLTKRMADIARAALGDTK